MSSIKSVQPPMDFARHQIAVVAERTGLSPDVLRVWERRYAAVDPARTPGGQRLYSDNDVARIRLLAAATRRGRNISLVARLSADELARLVAEDEEASSAGVPRSGASPQAEDVEAALSYTRDLDGPGLDRVLRLTIARHGMSVFLEDVAPPLMHRIGEEWRDSRLGIANEHLASAAVLSIIFESIRTIPVTPSAPCLLVTTPSGERHAVGAALAAVAAALDGWRVLYLGTDVPATDIIRASLTSGARAVALSVVHPEDLALVSRELRTVREGMAADVPLVVGGPAAVRISPELERSGLIVCASLATMRAVLARESALTPTLRLQR